MTIVQANPMNMAVLPERIDSGMMFHAMLSVKNPAFSASDQPIHTAKANMQVADSVNWLDAIFFKNSSLTILFPYFLSLKDLVLCLNGSISSRSLSSVLH